MKKLKYLCLIAICLIANFSILYATEINSKERIVKIEKEYEACRFTISLEHTGNYEVSLWKNGEEDMYKATITDDTSCEINVKKVEAGEWHVKVDSVSFGEETDIGKIQITAKAIDVSSMQLDEVTVARDIVGLKYYFKDDSIVVSWTDNSCGSVEVSIVNANNMQIIDKQIIDGKYYECEIPELVKEIVIRVVPTVSSHVEGAEIQYTKAVVNSPDARIEYEEKEYVNTDTIPVNVILNQPYRMIFVVNGKEVKSTGELKSGEHLYHIPIEEGNNEILSYIVDADGNMRSTKKDVIRDSIKPILNIDMDYDGLSTYDDIAYFTGNIKDYETFMVNEIKPVIAGDGSFKVEYVLRDGENKILMKATDIAGNETIYEATVYKLIREIPYSLYISLGTIALLGIVIIIRYFYSKKHNVPFWPERKKKKVDVKQEEKDKNVISKKNKKKKEKKVKTWKNELIGDIVLFVIVAVVFSKIILLGVIPSESMEPTLRVGNIAIVNGLAYVKNEPKRGDIIVFDNEELNMEVIKRVIGIPGDMITFEDGYVLINGQLCYEEYLDKDIETNSYKTFEVPENCYFVMGDNRENSLDSRFWENPYVSKEDIKGKYITQIPIVELKHLFKNNF